MEQGSKIKIEEDGAKLGFGEYIQTLDTLQTIWACSQATPKYKIGTTVPNYFLYNLFAYL